MGSLGIFLHDVFGTVSAKSCELFRKRLLG